MKILIIGGAGMIGRKLADRLTKDGRLGDREISELTLFDVVPAEIPESSPFPVQTVSGDLSAAGVARTLVQKKPDVIFHLAAIVSGEAEADFAKGYRINLDGTRFLLDAIAQIEGYLPRVVFTSSIAVFGSPFPESISDDYHRTPLTSYGTQKAICELLLSDFSRRGLLDGIGIRLPTICVRPGKPNKAASGFFSNIIREPLAGHEAICPVPETARHWHASPRTAVGFLMHAACIDTEDVGHRRNLSLPGVSATVGEQIEALRQIAGEDVVNRIRHEIDPRIAKIVDGWPQRFESTRALQLGFTADASFADIIRAHVEDELKGHIA